MQNCTVRIVSDDLVLLLSVSRRRTFSAAAAELGLSHTTVARRVQRLEKAMGGRLLVEATGGWELSPLGVRACDSARQIDAAVAALSPDQPEDDVPLRGLVRISAPEAFMNEVVTSAVGAVSRQHPHLQFDLLSVTRPTAAHGPSGDLDVTVARPSSRRLVTTRLADYRLGLYAAARYLHDNGPIDDKDDLRRQVPVYYVESVLQVADLDLLHRFFPEREGLLAATSVEAQLRLVAAGAGVGLLPTYVADKRTELRLQPVLPADAVADLTYWLVSRPENMRRREVAATADAIAAEANSRIPRP